MDPSIPKKFKAFQRDERRRRAAEIEKQAPVPQPTKAKAPHGSASD